MRRVSPSYLAGLLACGLVLTATGSRARAGDGVPKGRVDGLLAAYRTYGLPLPPADAPLVRYVPPYARKAGPLADGKAQPTPYEVGFLLQPARGSTPARLLRGLEEVTLSSTDVKVEATRPTPELTLGAEFIGWDSGFAFAMQCWARGWKTLAWARLAPLLGKTKTLDRDLAWAAWTYWETRLGLPDSDRAEIAKYLKVILSAKPKAFGKPSRALLRSLELALVPSKARPGSIDALIDGLSEVSRSGYGGVGDPRYWKVVHLGFDAVPTLLRYLDDDRLTRIEVPRVNNVPSFHYRVRDVVSDILQGLSGRDLGTNGLRRRQGYAVEKAEAEVWWKEARAIGEESYLVRHVLPPPGEKWANDTMLEVLAKKYPRRLAEVYRKLLADHPKMVSWPVAQAVSRSSLPLDVKRELILGAIAGKNVQHRREAFWELLKLDPKKFNPLLTRVLRELPAVPPGEYWPCEEAAFACLVRETTDAAVWTAFEKAAKRADAGLRLEYLGHLQGYSFAAQTRKHQLRLLAQFLDDRTVRDATQEPEKYIGPYAGFQGFARVQVRNFAAMQIGHILKMSEEPRPEWTDAQWSAFRRQVREALDRQGIRDGSQPGSK